MQTELEKAAIHVAAIRDGLNAIKDHAVANNDTTLLSLEAALHGACEAARADYLEARGATEEQGAALRHGEDKGEPPRTEP